MIWNLKHSFRGLAALAVACGALAAGAATAADDDEAGFEVLFDGKNLDKWQLVNKHGDGYLVKDGTIVCPATGGGNLFTKKEYSNFILRFEYRVSPGGNNGIGLRAPLEGNAAFDGMESQVLDDDAPQYANLEPGQYHGSIYKVLPAKRGAPKKAGEWNTEEIVCDGPHIKVTVNGKVTVEGNIEEVKDEKTLKEHPGLKRTTGHIGLLGHATHVEFRNLRVKPLPDSAGK